MPVCDDLKAAMDDLAADLREAERNELGHDLKTVGAGTVAGFGAIVIGGCLKGLIGGPKGCAGVALIAAGGALLGGSTTAVGAGIHARQAAERRRAIERAYNAARSEFCACLRGEDSQLFTGPELPPEPPEPDFTELEHLEGELDMCMEEEEPLCEMPDPSDQYTPSQEEEDDADLVCPGDEGFSSGGF